MKKIHFFLAVLLFFVMHGSSVSFAQLQLPQPSPKATVSQVVGLTDISVEYSRPLVKGRKIWGGLVPYNTLWRTGANKATLISFSDDVTIEGQKLAKGNYALFTIPSENEWTIIFNKNTELWGDDGYKQEEDALRIKVKPVQTAQHTESFTILFSNAAASSVQVDLVWEKLQVSFSVKVDTDEKVFAAMKEATAQSGSVFARSANYCLQNNTHMDMATQWIDKSIALGATFYNQWVKAQLLAKENNYKEAIALAEKAIAAGKAEGNTSNYRYYSDAAEKSLKEWKGKAGAK